MNTLHYMEGVYNTPPSLSTSEPDWLDTRDLRVCAWCPRAWVLHRHLGLDRASTPQLQTALRTLWRSADRDQRAHAATIAAEVAQRERRQRDEETVAARLGVPTSVRRVLGGLAGRTLVVGVGLWMLAWVPVWRDGPPGHFIGLVGPPALGLAAWLIWRRARHALRLNRGVVYRHAPGRGTGNWLTDVDLRLRGRPHRVARGTNGDLVVQVYRPTLNNPSRGDAVEVVALALLVEAHFREACSHAEVHFDDGVRRVAVDQDARAHLRSVLAYMRRIDSGAETAAVRADRACVQCGVRLMCPEGRRAAADVR